MYFFPRYFTFFFCSPYPCTYTANILLLSCQFWPKRVNFAVIHWFQSSFLSCSQVTTFRWHLGHCNEAYLPTRRGFNSHFGLRLGHSEGGDSIDSHRNKSLKLKLVFGTCCNRLGRNGKWYNGIKGNPGK